MRGRAPWPRPLINPALVWIALLVCGCLATVQAATTRTTATTAAYPAPDAFDRELLREINLLRTDPKAFVAHLQRRRKLIAEGSIQTDEGVAAVDEAIDVLKRTRPLPVLRLSPGLCAAAFDHVKDQAATGQVGHRGSDKSRCWHRANRHGKWRLRIGENIGYGYRIPRDVIVAMVVNDGVKNRGHRNNLLAEGYRAVGVAHGSHPKMRHMCVMVFAAGFIEKTSGP